MAAADSSATTSTTTTTDETLHSVTQALISTTRSASRLAAEDLPFHRSFDRRTAASLDQQNERLLALARRLLGCAVGDRRTDADTVGGKGIFTQLDLRLLLF